MFLALLTLAAVQTSDQDVETWIARLSNASLQEREEASARLQEFGEAGRRAIEAARKKAGDPAVRDRLGFALDRIEAEADLARAFSGAGQRVTVAAKGWTLKEALSRLIAPGVATVDSGDFDPEARIDFQLRSARWWEAWDRLAGEVGGRVLLKDSGDGRVHVSLARGKRPPAIYVDRFKIQVADVRRYAGNGNRLWAGITVEVLHPPDLLAGSRRPETAIRFESAREAEGRDARMNPPPFRTPRAEAPLTTWGTVWVRPESGALTVTGVTDVPFARDVRDVGMSVDGEPRPIRVESAGLRVESLESTREGTVLTIHAEAEEDRDLRDRLVGGSVALIDADGRRHEGLVRLRALGTGSCRYEVEFPPGIGRARRATFRWVAAFHRARIPFRFEEVTLPDFK